MLAASPPLKFTPDGSQSLPPFVTDASMPRILIVATYSLEAVTLLPASVGLTLPPIFERNTLAVLFDAK
jgi:hypothetical protein